MTTHRLVPEELRAVCDPEALPFVFTAELPPLDGMIGQDRAVSAANIERLKEMRADGKRPLIMQPSAEEGQTWRPT